MESRPRVINRWFSNIYVRCLILVLFAWYIFGRSAKQHVCVTKYIPPIKTRAELGKLLSSEELTVGVELGVQQGLFAMETLKTWHTCKRYYLVDLWAPQAHYKDHANVGTEAQEDAMRKARLNLAPWSAKLSWVRNSTVDASKIINSQVDYVYVDARHDYCGVTEDIQTWWKLLKPGGIMAGHDFEDVDDVKKISPSQDWSVCSNGSIRQGAVRGAVNDFFRRENIQVVVTYREHAWNTWLARKPLCFTG